MISHRCSKALRQVTLAHAPEVSAALAQLPAFLVPSFSQPLPTSTATRRRLHTTTGPSTLPHASPRRSPPRHLSDYSTAAARTAQVVFERAPVAQNSAPLDLKGKGKAVGDTANAPRPNRPDEQAGDETTELERPDAALDQKLLRIVQQLAPNSTRQQLLDVRKVLKTHDRLDDSRLVRRIVSIAFNQGFYDLALRLLNESANATLARNRPNKSRRLVWTYVEAAQYLGRARRWEFVVEVTNQALSKGLVSAPLLHVRMRGLNRRARYVETIKTFDMYDEHGLRRDGPAYDEVIEAHLLNADLATAQRVLAEKGELGFPTTPQTCLILIGGMALYGGNKAMEEKVLAEVDDETLARRKAVRQDVRVLNKILSVRAGRDATRDAMALLDYYNLERYPPELFARLRQLALPLEDAQRSSPGHLEHWKPAPDRATLVTLSGIALRSRRADLSGDLLSCATTRSLHLNDHIAAAIVRTLITQGSISAAEEFVFALPRGVATFRDFTYPAHAPSSFVFEVLMTGILRFRGLRGVNECFKRMTEAKLPPLRVTEGLTKALVDYLALERMEKLGVSANLLVKVKEITQGRTKPTRENLDTLLKAAWMSERLSLHEWTKMRKSIENDFPIPDLDDERIPKRPLPEIATVLARRKFESKASSDRVNALVRIRDSLSDRDVRHSGETAAHVLRNDHLIRFISAKWDYLQAQILDLGVRPTHDHFVALIRAYLVLGDLKGAVLALRYALTEAKVEPHVALYSAMISGLSRLGKHDLALSMYDEMRETARLEPDRQLFAALAMSCSRTRDVDGLERVFDRVRTLVDEGSRAGKNIDPALLAQAQAQMRARSRTPDDRPDDRSGRPTRREEEEDHLGRRPLSYDPLLDPVFITIYYRTLNAVGRNLDAQLALKSSLDRGLEPDRIVREVLQRTGMWLRWRANKDRRDRVEVDRSDALRIWRDNLERVRARIKRAKLENRHDDLRVIEAYWEKAERDDVDPDEWARFFEGNKDGR